MKKNNELIKFLFIGLCAFIITCLFPIIPPKISQSINDLSSWYIYSISKKSIKPLKLIGIAIDEYSLNKIQQRWPWKRSIYAQATNLLDKEKVNTIGFDFAFVGESEDKEDDRIFKESLKRVSSRVVLAYVFDLEKAEPVLPLSEFREPAYSLGMLNTPIDIDGKTRRLRGYIEFKGDFYYSFSIALSAAYLKQNPKDLSFHLPLLRDRTFFINYLLKPKDILILSFYDVLTNLEGLKQRYGNDFLKDSLVLIYPEAEILHDTYSTPLGKMPGGILHLNGVANIISGCLIKEIKILAIPFLILSFIIIFCILKYCGFLIGSLLTLGILALDFWGLVLLSLKGLKFDYSYVVIFSFTFFIWGNLYKYIYFLAQILKIKNKATLDPLRNLFTLRYFYYRLGLEMKKIYFRKDLFLVFMYLESFKEEAEDFPLEKIKDTWREISLVLMQEGNFWSVYSPDELVGCITSSAQDSSHKINSLKNNLKTRLIKRDIKTKIKLSYLRFKKTYPIRELLFILSSQLMKQKEDLVLFKDEDLTQLLATPQAKIPSGRLLESLDEDIEDKNRQLLNLLENLNQEHAKTKEAFFQIITSLVNALEARDPYTEGHSQRVCNYALKLAEKLGWSKEEKEKLRKAALLHDLGKIGIPDSILHKKGQLTKEEYNFIKKHEVIGVRILEPLKELNEILPWILYHHERWDGKGYPEGLIGEAIPEAAQIISLADVFDALTSGRDYKKAYARKEAIEEIVRNRGTQFNSRLTDLFIEMIHNP